jgi:hypothetical protein
VTTKRDPKNNFDPITSTLDGGTIWRDYDNPGRPVVTRGDELPQDVRDAERRRKSQGNHRVDPER